MEIREIAAQLRSYAEDAELGQLFTKQGILIEAADLIERGVFPKFKIGQGIWLLSMDDQNRVIGKPFIIRSCTWDGRMMTYNVKQVDSWMSRQVDASIMFASLIEAEAAANGGGEVQG